MLYANSLVLLHHNSALSGTGRPPDPVFPLEILVAVGALVASAHLRAWLGSV